MTVTRYHNFAENRETNEFRKVNFSMWQVTNEIFYRSTFAGKLLTCIDFVCLSLSSKLHTT